MVRTPFSLLAASLLVLACKASEPAETPAGGTGATPPAPRVVDDSPAGVIGASPAVPVVDALATDSGLDGDSAVGQRCDLLAQNCPAQHACYPAAAGRGACARGPDERFAGAECGRHDECGRGEFCADVCRTLCDPKVIGACPARELCRPLPGYPGVGSCSR